MELELSTQLCLLNIHRNESYGCAYFQLLGLLCDKLCLRLALLIFRLLGFGHLFLTKGYDVAMQC